MDQIVFVFSFSAEKYGNIYHSIYEEARKLFENVPDVSVYIAIEEVADKIIETLSVSVPNTSPLMEHARRELALLNNDEDFNRSILGAVRAFASYEHSGGSASAAILLLNDLLKFENLSPLTNNPDEWLHHEQLGPNGVWQSRRNAGAFSKDGGKTYYLLSEGANDQKPFPIHYSAEFQD